MAKTIRRAIAILLAATGIILLLLPASDVNAVYTKGDYVIDGGTLVSYTGNESDITIPLGITSIGKDAFSGNNSLTKVYIPDEVTSIDYAAFENCKNLQKVSIGDNVRSIGSSAFSGCQSLTDINIPKSTDTIGSGAFAACPNLSDISIDSKNRNFVCLDGVLYSKDGKKMYQYLAGRPYSTYDIPQPVSEIGEFGFYGSNMLTNVSIAQGVEEIPEFAFLNCTALNQVTIPSSVRAIRKGAFGGCPNLTKLNVPTNCGYIDDNAFTALDGTTGDVVNENTGEVLSESNTENTSTTNNVSAQNLEPQNTVVSSDSVSEEPATDNAEQNDNSLQNIAENVLDAAANAVESVANSDVTHNELSRTTIVGGEAVFLMNPKSLKVYGFDINAAQTEDSIADSGNSSSSGEDRRSFSGQEFDVIDGKLGHFGGSVGDVYIPEGVTKIGNRILYNNKNINSVTIPSTANEIGDFAFARSSVSSVSIPSSIDKIGYAAFYGCDNLTNIEIPTSVKDIELGALEDTGFMKNWKSVEDGNNFLVVGDNILVAYKGHGSDITIPSGIKKIGPGVFEGDTHIKSLILPESITEIGEDAFNGCSGLSSVELPKNLEVIEDRAFKDTMLSSIVIPSSVKEIGLGAFDTKKANGGMSAAIFKGLDLPNATYKPTATRLSASDLRTNSFNGTKYAFVPDKCDMASGNIFDGHANGFRGEVYSSGDASPDGEQYVKLRKCVMEPDINGNVEVDSKIRVGRDEYYLSGVSESAFSEYENPDWCENKVTNIELNGNNSNTLNELLANVNLSTHTGSNVGTGDDTNAIKVKTDGSINPLYVNAVLPGSTDKFILNINKQDNLKSEFEKAFDNRYGTHEGVSMVNYSIDMTDRLGNIPIKKMANNKLNITLPMPAEFMESENVSVATLDDNGLLEEISTQVVENKMGGKDLSFVASHLSPFAIYTSDMPLMHNVDLTTSSEEYSLDSEGEGDESVNVFVESVSMDKASASSNNALTGNIVYGTLQKEVAPGIQTRYIIAVLLISISGILFLYKKKKRM